MVCLTGLLLGAISLFIFFFFPDRLERQYVRAVEDKAAGIASMTAYGVRAGVYFDDAEAIQKAVEIARQNRELVYLVVENAEGRPLAVFNPQEAARYHYREAASNPPGDGAVCAVSTPVTREGKLIGRLFLGLSTRAVEEEVSRSRSLVAAISAIIFLVGLAAAFFIGRIVTRPLNRIIGIIGKISGENLKQRAPVEDIQSEAGQLARAFNRMLDELESAWLKYEEINRTLEKRIKVRTHELTREIAERRKIEEALRESNEQLKQLDNLKTEFISTVSHELRTPMTSVLGFAKICRRKLDNAVLPALGSGDGTPARQAFDQVRHDLEIIVNEGERLTSLINDVLDLAKLESDKMEWHMQPLQIRDVVAQAVEVVRPLVFQKSIEIRTEFGQPLPEILGDPDRILQVLINLLSNAVKFTDQGGVTCTVRPEGREVLVCVIDTGIGIAEQDLESVFDKFRQVGDTLTGKPRGTGLGLPITKHIIGVHKGRIWAESRLGEGSRFNVAFPAYEPSAGTPRESVS